MNDSFIGISMLSQYYFCKRRAGLLILGELFTENIDTIQGNILHQNVHKQSIEKRGKFIKVFELNVYSNKLKLNGFCDVVEFSEVNNGIYVPFLKNNYDIYPVEFKHGIKRNEIEYNIQLCAQAMCMEEMYDGCISSGAIYYSKSNSKTNIEFTQELRSLVINGSMELQNIQNYQILPKAKFMKKCNKCSMKELCQPQLPNPSEYINKLWKGKY